MAFHYANPFIIPMYNSRYPNVTQIPVIVPGLLRYSITPAYPK